MTTLQFDNKAYDDIENVIAPAAIHRFLAKGRDYKGAFALLGSRGQFSDINRKFWKLKSSIWDGQTLEGEQPMEIAEDIIGHCLLLIWILGQESERLKS